MKKLILNTNSQLSIFMVMCYTPLDNLKPNLPIVGITSVKTSLKNIIKFRGVELIHKEKDIFYINIINYKSDSIIYNNLFLKIKE